MKKNDVLMGKLYLIGTPLGNLDDMTFRAVETLKAVDEIYCEDTRRTSILLRHFEVQIKTLQSFHDHSPPSVLAKIKKHLLAGKSIGYVTDGGMPVISDPGFVLVRMCRDSGIPFTTIPGATASSILFSLSALPTPKYLFHGFFPRTKGEVEKTLQTISELPVAHMFYESPSRIASTLEVLNRNCPDTQVVLGRELTKLHEEVLYGTASELHLLMQETPAKQRGEFTIAIYAEPLKRKNLRRLAEKNAVNTASQLGISPQLADNSETNQLEEHFLSPEQEAEIASLIKSGLSSKDASKLLSKKFKVSRKIIYDFIIRHLT